MKTHAWLLPAMMFPFLLVMHISRMYNYTTFYYFDRMLRRVAFSLLVSAMFTGTMAFMLRITSASRLLIVILFAVSFITIVAKRMVARIACRAYRRRDKWTKAIFIGSESCYRRYTRFIQKTDMTYDFVELFDTDDLSLQQESFLLNYLPQNQIGEVVMVHTSENDDFSRHVCAICEKMGITMRLVADLFEMPLSQKYLSSIGTFPVVTYHCVSFDNVRMFVKRLTDMLLSSLALALSTPVLAITALAIRLESPGPVLFRQKRVGLNGKVFTIYKFRSMYIDAEERKKELTALNQCAGGMMFKIKNDPRITRIGHLIRKTSIDELPQLFNVLKGDMSLVGTRPPTLDEVEKYKPHHRRRISIRPGITGMWQVSGRSSIRDFEQVVALDTEYIDKWSLWLDIKLLFKTVAVVFMQQGAS